MSSSNDDEMKARDVKRANEIVDSLIQDIDCNLSTSEKESSMEADQFIVSTRKGSTIPERNPKKSKEMDFDSTLRKLMSDDQKRLHAKKSVGVVRKPNRRMKHKI